MPINKKLTTKDIALTICFAALYTVLSFFPLSPIIGLPGKTITASAMTAPIIGLLLGPYFGSLSTVLGGTIGFFAGSFSPLSFASGAVAALCAGLLHLGKRSLCALFYLLLLVLFGFYPSIGPAWLCPLLMWFQIAGFLLLVSPLQSNAAKNLNSNNNLKIFSALFITFLTSTLAGQIAGSLVFELILMADLNWWKSLWLGLTFLYPVERTIIALGASLLGAFLLKILKSTNLTLMLNRAESSENV